AAAKAQRAEARVAILDSKAPRKLRLVEVAGLEVGDLLVPLAILGERLGHGQVGDDGALDVAPALAAAANVAGLADRPAHAPVGVARAGVRALAAAAAAAIAPGRGEGGEEVLDRRAAVVVEAHR